MSKQVQEAYIVAATRTPVGKAPRGMFRTTCPDDDGASHARKNHHKYRDHFGDLLIVLYLGHLKGSLIAWHILFWQKRPRAFLS